MKKASFFSAVCYLTATLCFGLVTFGNFYRGNNTLAVISLCATILNLISLILHIKRKTGDQ